jgi:hypothetical protein
VTGARIIAAPHLDGVRRLDATAPAGATVLDIVGIALPLATPEMHDFVRVTIGDDLIPREWWPSVRPKPCAVVIVRVVPGNSGVLRSVLSIAVGVAALALGQLWVGPALATSSFGTALGLTNATAGALVSGAAMLAGTFLINAFVPLKRPEQSGAGNASSPSYSPQGFKNVANPDGVVPCVMGKIRFAPPYAALPWTEVINGETFIRALFLVGYGPVALRNIRLGDTPIEKFKEVEIEVREGYATDDPITLYPTQVLEERLSVDLNKAYSDQFGAHTRFTASDATECSVDFTFPSGLFWMHTVVGKSSSTTYPIPFTVTFRISQRLNGVGDWSVVVDLPVTAFSQKAFSSTYRWALPTRDRYEIRVERLTADFDDLNAYLQYDQFVSLALWSAIRSFRPEYPIAFPYPLALIAVRIKGTKQLNGVLDDLNVEASRICKDWDAGTSTWVERETANPASLYRYALQGPMNAYPRDDDEIDLAWLQNDFHPHCVANGLAYNRVHDFETSVFDVMEDICGAGRASPRDDGEKWSGVIDRRQTIVYGHITTRNAWEFSFERPNIQFPHGFRVKFQDETNSYKQAERVVPWPGFVGVPTITESIELPGKTNPDEIWIEARKRMYETMYRPDTWTVMRDFEAAVEVRGDLCQFSYDTLDKTQRSARVQRVSDTMVLLDEHVTMEVGKSYAIRIRKLAATDVDEDQSVVRTVQTVEGVTDVVYLTGSGVAPAVGDLVMFGEAAKVSFAVLVKDKEGTEDFGARETLIPYAPEIFDLLDAEVPPAWNGRVGEEIGGTVAAPATPIVGAIASLTIPGSEPSANIFVPMRIGSGGGAPTTFDVDHRLSGASVWTTVSIAVATGSATISGYSQYDVVELRARAVNTTGASAYTSTKTLIVALGDSADWGAITASATAHLDVGSIAATADQSVDWGSF